MRIFSLLAAFSFVGTVSAEPKTIQEALAIVLEEETIKAGGEKMKLYMASSSRDEKSIYYSFNFWDGGENTHTVSVDKNGKTRYFAKEKSKFMRIFDDLDFTKLPAPSAIFIEDIEGKCVQYLAAVGFIPAKGGRIIINYSLRSEYRQKDKAKHVWNVTMPIADGKRGKIVVFANGELEAIMHTNMYGS